MQYYQLLSRPIVAAHRGLASLFPENTLEAFKAALQYADFVEMDVVLAKNNELVVCHDPFLSLVSDIASHPEFEGRKKLRKIGQHFKEDWWIADFTVEELKSLKLRQCILNRSQKYDWMYSIPTLEETLNYLLQLNLEKGTNKGVLLEIKDELYHQEYCQTEIANHALRVLNKLGLDSVSKCYNQLPIVLMSFDAPILKICKERSDLPRVYLLEQLEGQPFPPLAFVEDLAEIAGIDIKLLWDNNRDQMSALAEEAKTLGLKLYGWTFQDDNQELRQHFGCQHTEDLYKRFKFLDGYITEFPQTLIK